MSSKESNSDYRVKRRVSTSKKQANDFARQKEIIDSYDYYYGYYRNNEDLEKYDLNWDLFNGRLDQKAYGDAQYVTVNGKKIKLDEYPITHYPLISQVANTMHGELINRPFIATVEDNSPFAKTLYTKKRNELLMAYFNENILQPARQMATLNWMQQYGVQDVFSLSPEEQQQMQADIERRMQQEIPEDILNFMNGGYRSPTQKVLQRILDAHKRTDFIVAKSHEGGKQGLVTGREVYRSIEINDRPVFEVANGKFFTWAGSQHVEWFQHGSWCRYEEWLTYEDVMQRFGGDLRNKDIKQIEGLVEPIGGYKDDPIKDGKKDNMRRAVQYEISVNTDEYIAKYGEVDINTQEGQSKMVTIMNNVAKKYGATYGSAWSNYGFRVAHFNWKDQRKLYRVTREENGELKKYWVDETYERQPQDVEIKERWVNETWEGYKIGTHAEPIYTKIRAVPWQFTSKDNPFTAELCYYGKDYNRHMNNSKNVAHLDRGKPWNLEFDVEMAALKHDLKTNVGKVFMMVMDLKPDNYTEQEWINMMRNFHILAINPSKPGSPVNRIDPALLREIDLSKMSDIASRIQLLEFAKNNLIQDMFFSPARIGSIGQYATQANIQSNQTASYNQTENFFKTHREIIDAALTGYLKLLRYSAKKHPERYENVLDDIGIGWLKAMPAWSPEIDVTISGSGSELQELERLRQLMLTLSQNGMMPDTIVKLALAETKGEILDIVDEDKRSREAQQQQQMQAQQQQLEMQIQAQQQEKQQERDMQYTMHLEKLRSQEERQQIDSQKFQLQNDVDMNQMADTIQKAILELGLKEKMHEDTVKLKEEELRLKEKEIDNRT